MTLAQRLGQRARRQCDPVRTSHRGYPIDLIGHALLLVGELAAGSIYAVRVNSAVNQNLQRSDDLPPVAAGPRDATIRPPRPPASLCVRQAGMLTTGEDGEVNVGERLADRYRLDRPIGSGGMGQV